MLIRYSAEMLPPLSLQIGRFMLFLLVSLVLSGCTEPRGGFLSDENGLTFTDLSGSSTIIAPREGKQFLLRLEAGDDWTIVVEGGTFVTLSTSAGKKGEYSIVLSVANNPEAERKASLCAKLSSGKTGEIYIIQQGSSGSGGDEPSLLGNEHILGDVTLLELPRISGNEEDYFVTHRVDGGKRVNYSLEWNTKAYHSRWVCFSIDEETKQIRTGRSDDWRWDPMIPSIFEVFREDFDKNVFARGHLVASYDRVYSEEANRQTFYYTNMSPQRHAFNSGIWQKMEQFVQVLGRSLRSDGILYVAKGGTIRPDQVEEHRSNHKIVIPKYYWMALLKNSEEKWQAMGFLVEHKTPDIKGGLLSYALSVDELEDFTGLDFFFNLPDEIESRVEVESPDSNLVAWPGL